MQNLVTALPPSAPAQPGQGTGTPSPAAVAKGFGAALSQALAEPGAPGRSAGQPVQASTPGLQPAPGAAADGATQATPLSTPTASGSPEPVTVRKGDTLTGLVKAQFRGQGVSISDGRAWRMALQVARDNGLANPDRIEVGQQIDLQGVRQTVTQLASLAPGEQVIGPLPAWRTSVTATSSQGPAPAASLAATARIPPHGPANSEHPVLERILSRAVDKGFVPAGQVPAVRERVLTLAGRYNFAPDDFARLTLMESGGMNPQASNGRCHGIIQFCEGAHRGAASVGLQANPRSILGMGLLQQLELVDRYFANVGLQPGGPRLQLDDLYLAVLTPAARSEQRRDAPLDIPGPQASLLHVNRDRRAPITRNSIFEGLHTLTEQVLQLSRRSGTRLYAELAGPTLPRP